MDTTTFLAQLWGPVLLAIGLGMFVSRNYYAKVYRDIEKSALGVMTFGVVAMTAGIAQITFHNVWNTFPEMVVSLLGWGAFLKGAVFLIAPKLADQSGEWAADSKLIPTIGILVLVLGLFLSWFGFFA